MIRILVAFIYVLIFVVLFLDFIVLLIVFFFGGVNHRRLLRAPRLAWQELVSITKGGSDDDLFLIVGINAHSWRVHLFLDN